MRVRVVMLTVLTFLVSNAPAQTMLKLQGEAFAPIRQKTLETKMKFVGDFATTDLKLTFFNPAFTQREADFLYTVPDGALVTSFAYWFKDERVPAQMVERERAEVIYEAIRSRRRDPALIEMVGRRTFRARIFPIEGRADLRIEMTMVSVAKDGAFVLPLVMEKGKPLESVKIDVVGRPGSGVTNVVNNLGVASSYTGGVFRMSMEEAKWRPDKDLRIGLQREGLRASLFSRRSGGGSGFFALNITSDSNVPRPKVSIRGVSVSNLHTPSAKALKPGDSLCVTGRYSGSGPAVVTLYGDGASKSAKIVFESSSEPNNLASKLWAADEIEALGRAPSNAAKSRATSLRYTIPGPYTSWLAIPLAERKNFDLQIRSARAVVAARKIAAQVLKGKGYLGAKASLDLALVGEPKDVRQTAGQIVIDAARDVANQHLGTLQAKWEKRVADGRSFGATERAELAKINEEYRRFDPRSRIEDLYLQNTFDSSIKKIGTDFLSGRATQSEVDREVARLQGWLSRDRSKDQWAYEVTRVYERAEYEYVNDVMKNGQPSETSAASHDAALRVKNALGVDTKFRAWSYDYRVNQWAQLIADDGLEGRPESLEAANARQRIDQIRKWLPLPATDKLVESARFELAHMRARQTASEYVDEVRKSGATSDSAKAKLASVQRYAEIGKVKTDKGFWNDTSWAAYHATQEFNEMIKAGASADKVLTEARNQQTRLKEAGLARAAETIDKTFEEGFNWSVQSYSWEIQRPNPDEKVLADQQKAMRVFGELTGKFADQELQKALERPSMGGARWAYLQELRKPNPDPEQLEEFKNAMIDDGGKGKDYVDLQTERIQTDVMIDALEKEPRTPDVEAQLAKLRTKYEELHARMGDPLIQIKLPEGTVRAFARLPWGEILELKWNPTTKLWEARFDVPAYAMEGRHMVVVTGVAGNGVTSKSEWSFVVDVSSPACACFSTWNDGDLTVAATASRDVARAKLVVPWGAPVEFVSMGPGRMVATVSPPKNWNGGHLNVVVFDKAHNRTEVTVFVGPRP